MLNPQLAILIRIMALLAYLAWFLGTGQANP